MTNLCVQHLANKNKIRRRRVLQAWKNYTYQSVRENQEKLDQVGIQNYSKVLRKWLSGWAKWAHQKAILRRSREKVEQDKLFMNKSKVICAWKRAYNMSRISSQFRSNYLKKSCLNGLNNAVQYRQIEEALYYTWVEHHKKSLMKIFYKKWHQNSSEARYDRYIRVHKTSKMVVYNKKRILKAWRCEIQAKVHYKSKYMFHSPL